MDAPVRESEPRLLRAPEHSEHPKETRRAGVLGQGVSGPGAATWVRMVKVSPSTDSL